MRQNSQKDVKKNVTKKKEKSERECDELDVFMRWATAEHGYPKPRWEQRLSSQFVTSNKHVSGKNSTINILHRQDTYGSAC
jgi:hypothetical protein